LDRVVWSTLVRFAATRPSQANVQTVEKLLPISKLDPLDKFETPLPSANVISAARHSIPDLDHDVGIGEKRKDNELVRGNDSALFQWFALWSVMHFEAFRHFNVIHGELSKSKAERLKDVWGSEWRHVSGGPDRSRVDH